MPRISQLPSLTAADNADELAIVDVSASTTKKITRGDLLKAPLPNNSVTTAAVANSAVTLPKINGGTAAGLLTTDASGLVTAKAVIRQDNTTNSALPGFRLEHGWGWFTGSGANFGSKTMTFSSTFNNAPVVVVSMIGYKDGSNPSSISDFSYWESCSVNAGVLKNTGFNVGYRTLDGSNINSNRRIGYSWIAIGT